MNLLALSILQLVEVDVSKNRLTSIPASIGGCSSLQELRLAGKLASFGHPLRLRLAC